MVTKTRGGGDDTHSEACALWPKSRLKEFDMLVLLSQQGHVQSTYSIQEIGDQGAHPVSRGSFLKSI